MVLVVLSRSKIKISKAIHNKITYLDDVVHVVLSRSKIKISKAIHNGFSFSPKASKVVLSRSKIKISKAIHNRKVLLYFKIYLPLRWMSVDTGCDNFKL